MLTMPRTVILIFGLPGSGKTTLAKKLQEYLNCLWFNADKVRATISSDLGFSEEDRLKQATRLGQLCAISLEYESSHIAVVDFVCPTLETRTAFRKGLRYPSSVMKDNTQARNVDYISLPESPEVFTVFMNTISRDDSRYSDTSRLFQRPSMDEVDLMVNAFPVNAGAGHELFHGITRVVDSSRMPGLKASSAPHGWYFDGNHLQTGV